MAGRKTKLTPERQSIICTVLRDGATFAAAAAAASITENTLHEWRRHGAEQKSGIHSAFVDALAKAIDEGEAIAAAAVRRSFTENSTETVVEELSDGGTKTKTITRPPDSSMALRWLERRAGSRWNVAARIAVGGDPDGAPLQTVSAENALAGLDKLTGGELSALAAIEDAMRTRATRPDEDQSVAATITAGVAA